MTGRKFPYQDALKSYSGYPDTPVENTYQSGRWREAKTC